MMCLRKLKILHQCVCPKVQQRFLVIKKKSGMRRQNILKMNSKTNILIKSMMMKNTFKIKTKDQQDCTENFLRNM